MLSYLIRLILVFSVMAGCQTKAPEKEFSFKNREPIARKKASTSIDLESKGVGPITQVSLAPAIQIDLAKNGENIYQEKCTACHKIGSTFIGPPPNGILDRRRPEWVMNMIMNPDKMIREDSLAKALFMEFNGQLMTNQQVSEKEARAILEYFRTLEKL